MRINFILIFFLLSSCNSKKHELPILSYYINDDGKKVFYTISHFKFRNQLNQTFTEKNIENKIVLANFFFTRCPTICPKMKKTLKSISENFNSSDNFLITSFSIDSKYDSVLILKSYAESSNIDHNKWQFLTGSEDQLKKMAKLFRTSFNKKNNLKDDFYHSSYSALIDGQQRIRGFYNLLDKKSVDNLENDIKSLLK